MKTSKSGIVEAMKKENKALLAEARRALKEDYINGGRNRERSYPVCRWNRISTCFRNGHTGRQRVVWFDLSAIPDVWVYMLDAFLAWWNRNARILEYYKSRRSLVAVVFISTPIARMPCERSRPL